MKPLDFRSKIGSSQSMHKSCGTWLSDNLHYTSKFLLVDNKKKLAISLVIHPEQLWNALKQLQETSPEKKEYHWHYFKTRRFVLILVTFKLKFLTTLCDWFHRYGYMSDYSKEFINLKNVSTHPLWKRC